MDEMGPPTSPISITMASKGEGRNVPMATMLSQLSKLSIDESSCLDSFKVFDKLPFELRIKIVSTFLTTPIHDSGVIVSEI